MTAFSEQGSSYRHVNKETWFNYSNKVQPTLGTYVRSSIISKLLLLVRKYF